MLKLESNCSLVILLRLQYWEKYWTACTQSACALYNGGGFNTHTRFFFLKTDWNHDFLERCSRSERAWEQTVVLVRCYNTFNWPFGFCVCLLFLFSVAHHDPENTFNCSFIEPPSVAEQLSPSSWSSQESFSSFDSGEEERVYCVPNEGE